MNLLEMFRNVKDNLFRIVDCLACNVSVTVGPEG